MPRTDLAAFAAHVLTLVASAPKANRFGRKVFLCALGRINYDTLLEAHKAGLVTLSRCDLVEHFDAELVRRSEMTRGGEWHFITDPSHTGW